MPLLGEGYNQNLWFYGTCSVWLLVSAGYSRSPIHPGMVPRQLSPAQLRAGHLLVPELSWECSRANPGFAWGCLSHHLILEEGLAWEPVARWDWSLLPGHVTMASGCSWVGSGWILGTLPSLKVWRGIVSGSPGQWWSPPPWRCSRIEWMRCGLIDRVLWRLMFLEVFSTLMVEFSDSCCRPW